MGLLSGIFDINLQKATISLWFRLSSDAVEAVVARDASYEPNDDPPVFRNIIPLIVFGAQQTGTIYDWFGGQIGTDVSGDGTEVPVFGAYVNGSHPVKIQPSCIGVSVDGVNPPKLFFNLQSNSPPSCANTSNDSTLGDLVPIEGDPGSLVLHFINHADTSYTDQTLHTAYFGNAHLSAGPEVALNQWHHVIMAWDVSGQNVSRGRAIDGSDADAVLSDYFSQLSTVYCAVDDQNKSGAALPAQWIDGAGDNAVAIQSVYEFAGAVGNIVGTDGQTAPPLDGNQCHVTWPGGHIPSSPIWLPAPLNLDRTGTASIVPNQLVQMAELQIFAGIALDTGNINNRRLFIDNAGAPVNPSVAAVGIGQSPDILLHRGSSWVSGSNTGSLESFTPSGTISVIEFP